MKTIKTLIVGSIMIATSSAVMAQGMDPSMMQQYPGGMSPEQMQQMHQQRMQNGMPMGRGPGMGGGPMMSSHCNKMMMDPAMRENMMQQRGGNMHGGMMNPQMMQMRQQHMEKMQQRLDKIEAMLAELIELQKSK